MDGSLPRGRAVQAPPLLSYSLLPPSAHVERGHASEETDATDRNFVARRTKRGRSRGTARREGVERRGGGVRGRGREGCVRWDARFRRLTFRLQAGRDARDARCRVEWRRSKPKSK